VKRARQVILVNKVLQARLVLEEILDKLVLKVKREMMV
jgi:hypothetical protein